MKNIEITLSDEQYADIMKKIERCSNMNLEETVLTGSSFTLSDAFPGISHLAFEMQHKIDLGYVSWSFMDSK